jgi:hypothetical protein
LYTDLAKMEAAADGASLYGTNLVGAMQADGSMQRIPASVRRRITALYAKFSEFQAAIFTVKRAIQQQTSFCISQMRTEESDRKWAAAISEKMRSIPETGISSVYQFNMKHAGRSAALDVRDPEHPKVAFPGGPTFTLLDWLNYPASVPEVEAAWVDDGFLYFDEQTDRWYYRITEEDLRRRTVSLRQFLDPMHHALQGTPEFRDMAQKRSNLVNDIRTIKNIVADRLRDPVRIRDVID